MADDEYDDVLAGFARHKRRKRRKDGRRLEVSVGEWSERDIASRPWIAPGYLMRGSVTLLAGMGSAGKSMLTLGYACACCLHREWGAFKPVRACKVSILNVEDDPEEQKRRISAVLRQFNATSIDLGKNLARLWPTDVGTLLLFDMSSGDVAHTEIMDELEKHLDEFRPDVLILDPLVELHTAPENDNIALRAIVAYFRQLAVDYNMAVILIHHSRKGLQSPGDPDVIRGASAIVGAVRVALTVCVMSKEEAEELGISEQSRRKFFRVDGAKSNYAPAREAEWFERRDYELGNEEWVSAAVPWASERSEPSHAAMLDLIAAVERGHASGPWSPKLSDDDRSIRRVLDDLGIRGSRAQTAALRKLQDSYGVRVRQYRSQSRNPHSGLRAQSGLPPAKWIDE